MDAGEGPWPDQNWAAVSPATFTTGVILFIY
jgi:hypothetical protein